MLAGLNSLKHLDLSYNQLTELPAGFFDGLSALYEVRLLTNELAAIRQDAFRGLTQLRLLDLEFNELPTLPGGVFSGLDLVFLGLERNKLQTLTSEMFAGMDAEGIDLSHNGTTSIAASTFSGAHRLKELDLGFNNLTELPAELLKGRTKLKYLWLRTNPGADFTFTMQVERVAGTNKIVVRVDEGAPFDMTTTISTTGGTLPAGMTSVTVPTGRTKSVEIPVNSINGTTVTLGTAPTVPSGNFTGVATAVGAPVTFGDATEATTLSASFPQSPYASAAHTGAADRPQVVVEFSEAVASFEKTTPSVSINNGTVRWVAAHTESGLINAYIFVLTPTGDDHVTFTLAADAACDAGGICTAGGTQLTEVPATRTIPGPGETAGELTVSDARASEDDTTIDFVVTLDPTSDETVTVDYATSNGTATGGSDYTAKSGTLTFNANETSKTVSVAILDDDEDESDETLALTLSNAANAEIEDDSATGTIEDDDASSTALTATFENVPAEHDGETSFSFNVAFTTEVAIGYASMRDDAFTVTEGDVTQARRIDGRSDRWEITVEPDGNEDIAITLAANRACTTTGAICSKGLRPGTDEQQAVGDRRRADGDGGDIDTYREHRWGKRHRGRRQLDHVHRHARRSSQRNGDRRLRDVGWQRRCRRRLHRHERHGELLRWGNEQDDLRRDRGRHRERERRDVHRRTLEPLGRRPRNNLGYGHHPEPARGAADRHLQQRPRRARRKRVHLRPRLQRERESGLRSSPRRCGPRDGGHNRESPAEDPGQQPELDHHGGAARERPDRNQPPGDHGL